MTATLRLLNATTTNGAQVDVAITGDTITYVGDTGTSPDAARSIDLSDHILSIGFAEPHAHLDKAFLADRIVNPSGDLMGAIQGLHAVRNTLTHDDMVARATRALRLMSQNGVTSVRTHADTTLDGQLSSILALIEAKNACSSFIEVQIAMLLEWPLTGTEGASRRALALDAIAAGVDVIGGCPHLDPNPTQAADWLLELACEHQLPLDLHADENLRTDSRDLEHIAQVMLSQNIQHQVNASHCVSLSTLPEREISRVAELVAQADISVTALPQTNLFLQGRGITTNVPRAITPLTELNKHGVTVAAGADNLQDPFNLMGRGDPLEIASLLVTASHVTPEFAMQTISTNAAKVIHNQERNIAVGHVANLVAIPTTTVREAIAMGPPDRFVVYGGVAIPNQK